MLLMCDGLPRTAKIIKRGTKISYAKEKKQEGQQAKLLQC